MEENIARKLLHWLESRREEMVDCIGRLARIETPSTVPETHHPILTLLAESFVGVGFRARLIPGRDSGGHLLAYPADRQRQCPIQLLLGHCDTVWPLGILDTMPLQRKDGKLYGPGVYDMKAGLVQMLFALRALKAFDLSPPVTPVVFINSDEEIGSPESRCYITRLASLSNRVLVLEPSLGPTGRLKTARKGVGRFTITIHGKAAHAGLNPEEGVSAILELSHLIQALYALNDPERGISINVGTIDGGLRANVVAPTSTAVIDVRVLTQRDAEAIEKAIYALKPASPGIHLEIQGRIGRPPMERTHANRILWDLAREGARELGFELEEGTAGGGSDGNTTSLYTATLDGLGAVGDGAHAAHEHIELAPLPQRTALLARLMTFPPLPPRYLP